MKDEGSFAPSVLTLTRDVNIHLDLTEVPPVTMDNKQFLYIKLTQTSSVLVQCHLEDGSRSVDGKSRPVEQRIRSPTQVMAVPGKTLAGGQRNAFGAV